MLRCEPVGAAAAAPVVNLPVGRGDPRLVVSGLSRRAVRRRLRRRRVRRPFDVTGLGGGDTRAATRLPLHTLILRRRCEWEREQADEQDQTLHGTPPLRRTKNRAPARTARGPISKVTQLILRRGDVTK